MMKRSRAMRSSIGCASAASVFLAIAGCAWVQVGGGPIGTSSASQQPSLALCGEPTVAWIETVQPGAIGLLNVSHLSGSAWSALGVTGLNQSSAESAAEPSLDCVDGQPVVGGPKGPGRRETCMSSGGMEVPG